MEQYKIIIEDRNCEEWTISNNITMEDVLLTDFIPLSHKLFNGDIFTYDGTVFKLIHSCTKSVNYFSGVLVLEKNKSYGKYKDKHLYYQSIDELIKFIEKDLSNKIVIKQDYPLYEFMVYIYKK